MIKLRPASERGRADHGWLKTFHTFSFASYYDPREVGYSCLRVINDDTVAPVGGFSTHAHHDMEILSLVLEGALEHQDSLGHVARITPWEVQRLSAGTGVNHSEYNPSRTTAVHFLQIWLEPDRKGLVPSYEQKTFAENELRGVLRLIASPDGREGSVTVHQDACLYRTVLADGEKVTFRPRTQRRIYVHVCQGEALLNGQVLGAGSGARIDSEATINLEANDSADVLLFDLP